jgi:hypothetical protein
MVNKRRPESSKALIERVRKAALALPGTTEKLSHGEPSFYRGRMFITVDNNHHGSGHLAIWCRAEPGVLAEKSFPTYPGDVEKASGPPTYP